MTTLSNFLKKIDTLNKQGKFEEAIKQLPEETLERRKNAALYVEKALAQTKLYVRNRNLELLQMAIENYEKAIILDPKRLIAFRELGALFAHIKNYPKAIENYKAAKELDPKCLDTYVRLGEVYFNKGEFLETIIWNKMAIEKNEDYAEAYGGLGDAYFRLGEFEDAIKNYKCEIKKGSTVSYPHFRLGNIYLKENNSKGAIECLKRGIEIDKEYEYAYYDLGMAYIADDKHQLALDNFKIFLDKKGGIENYDTIIVKLKIKELNNIKKYLFYKEVSDAISNIRKLLLYEKEFITHYTTLDVAKILIFDDAALFRLSEGTFLNDPSEGTILLKLFERLRLNVETKLISEPNSTTRLLIPKPFIGSFVAMSMEDDLNLWRMYGKNEKDEGKGCSITLTRKPLIELIENRISILSEDKTESKNTDHKDRLLSENFKEENFNFYNVVYYTSGEVLKFTVPGFAEGKTLELEENVNVLIEKVNMFVNEYEDDRTAIRLLEEKLNDIAYLFKTDAYKFENEVRLVIHGVGLEKKFDYKQAVPRVYIDLFKINSLVTKITLGPKVNQAQEIAAAFNYSLSRENHKSEIIFSHLPFK